MDGLPALSLAICSGASPIPAQSLGCSRHQCKGIRRTNHPHSLLATSTKVMLSPGDRAVPAIAHKSPDNLWDPAAKSLCRQIGEGQGDSRQARGGWRPTLLTLAIHLGKVPWCGHKLRAFPWFLSFLFIYFPPAALWDFVPGKRDLNSISVLLGWVSRVPALLQHRHCKGFDSEQGQLV